MSNELIKSQLVIDKNIGKETTQILLEGDIIVPDIKPDMSVILQTDSNVVISRLELTNDRVNFIGKLDISLLYLARGSEKPIHSITLTEQIDDFINIEGVTKDMYGESIAIIKNIDYKMLNDRKVNYRAVVEVSVQTFSFESFEVIKDIGNIKEEQCLKKTVCINRNVENKEDSFVVKDEISIPIGKPSIRELLQTSITVNNKEARVSLGKVFISGELIVTILYKGDNDNSVVEFLETEVPFNGSVSVDAAKDDMFADVSLVVKEKLMQIKPDSDGEDRVIDIEATILNHIRIFNQENLTLLEDAYIINKNLDVSKKKIKYPKLICKNKNQTQIKEIVLLDDQAPLMFQIYRISGVAHLESINVLDDKVIVDGLIETNILYVAEDDNTPLFCYKTIIPFKQVIETKGSRKNMNVNIQSNIEHVGFNMLSGKEVEVRFLISFNAYVTADMELNVITDIDISDMDDEYLDSFSSITAYSVQQGDTIWKIAKRYNTTLDEIVEMNNIENVNMLSVGQKILILKKVLV